MNSFHCVRLATLVVAGSLALAASSSAQQKQSLPQRSTSYDVSRETVLSGTIISFTPQSAKAPLGAHAAVQTSSGPVDVHLGNPNLLQNAGLTLNPGDSIKITGESVAYGNRTQFLARVIQKGNQSLTVRTVRGFPIRPVNAKNGSQGGVL